MAEILKEKDLPEDLGVDGRIIIKFFLVNCIWCVDWINLTQDRDMWRALVVTAIEL
jgi:hypothetical protein